MCVSMTIVKEHLSSIAFTVFHACQGGGMRLFILKIGKKQIGPLIDHETDRFIQRRNAISRSLKLIH